MVILYIYVNLPRAETEFAHIHLTPPAHIPTLEIHSSKPLKPPGQILSISAQVLSFGALPLTKIRTNNVIRVALLLLLTTSTAINYLTK